MLFNCILPDDNSKLIVTFDINSICNTQGKTLLLGTNNIVYVTK